MTFSEIPFSESEKSLVRRDFQSITTLAWEAVVLPIYESCIFTGIIADADGKFNHNLSRSGLYQRERYAMIKQKAGGFDHAGI